MSDDKAMLSIMSQELDAHVRAFADLWRALHALMERINQIEQRLDAEKSNVTTTPLPKWEA